MMKWRFYQPPEYLRSYIVNYHFIEGSLPLKVSKWVRYLIHINYGPSFSVTSHDTGEKFTNADMCFTGISTSPKFVDEAHPHVNYVAIELSPLCVSNVLFENMIPTSEKCIDVKCFSGLNRLCWLVDALAQTRTDEEKIAILNAAFTRYFASIDFQSSHLLDEVLNIIRKLNGNLTLSDLSKNTGRSKRTIQRLVTEKTGASPDFLRRTVRSEAVITKLLSEDLIDMQDIVYDFGYYDQAHLIKDIKASSFFTPGELRQIRHQESFAHLSFLKKMSGSAFLTG